MNLNLLSLASALAAHASARQRLIAENVANADTPGYKARDLKDFSFQAHVQAASGSTPGTSSVAATPAGVMAVTQPGHMQPKNAPLGAKPVKALDSEVTLDGNGVVLEDEMVKLTQARMDYDAAIGFYQKSIGLLKMAIRKPGA